MTVNDYLIPKIAEKLRTIDPNTLQIIAEDMAIIKFPGRFQHATLHRKGRNLQAQTTKGWPDAYVTTGTNIYDAVEATRDVHNWGKHLDADLKNAQTRGIQLSGFFFLGGCSNPDVEEDVSYWEDAFAGIGIPRSNITILVNRELAFELARSEYARIRHHLLKIPVVPHRFSLLMPGLIGEPKLGDFQPTPEDFDHGWISKPSLFESVIDRLLSEQCALVRGRGACGKTTLAQLVSVDPRILPAPTYYLDLAKHEPAEIGGEVMNELVDFGAKGVLFVLDNVHLDERFSRAVLQHWQTFCKNDGVRLLMLGRQTKSGTAIDLGPLKGLKLNSGRDELLGVVRRIFLQNHLNVPEFSSETIDRWIRTFGEDPEKEEIAVDLVAFGAAVQLRLSRLQKGELTLTHGDAVDAVAAKYLAPIESAEERANLLRLASLADYEILVPKVALAYPEAGLSTAADKLGIVDKQITPGRESRIVFSLVHAALGPLLIAAADEFNPVQERAQVVTRNPAIGLQIIARRCDDITRGVIREAVKSALENSGWTKYCYSFDEWVTVLRGAKKVGIADLRALDEELRGSMRCRIASHQCSLNSLTRFLLEAKRHYLNGCISMIFNMSDDLDVEGIKTIVCCARPDEVANFIEIDERGLSFLRELELDRWREGQEQVPIFNWPETISACRKFESWGRSDLASLVASKLIRANVASMLASSMLAYMHFGLLSHLIRLSDNTKQEKQEFLLELGKTGWLAQASVNTSTTHLCGALMSLSSYLEKELRPFILSEQLTLRVQRVLDEGWNIASEKSALKKKKAHIFTICLLGAFASFGGELSSGYQPILPRTIDLELLLGSSLLKNDGKSLGMYELQFWLGLREFSKYTQTPAQVSSVLAESFAARLEASSAPTANALEIKRGLMTWLCGCKKQGWRLIRDL